MRVMEVMRICAVVGAISLCGAGAARAGAVVVQVKANGATAAVNSFNGTTAFDLGVSRNDTSSGSSAFLSFETQTCSADFTVCSGVFGFGNIPSGDFSVNGANATLNTNTATNPNFTVFNYVNDFANNIFTQTPATGGIVTVNWKKIPRQSQSFVGTQSVVFGPFSNKITGQQDSDSANSSGTLLGMPMPTNGPGIVGTNKTSQIIINRN